MKRFYPLEQISQGIKLGRSIGPDKSKLDQFRPEIEALLKSGST